MGLPVNITEKALKEIRHIMDTKNIPLEYGLRIGIKGGGCAGINFLLGFDKLAADDSQYQVDGLQVLISKKHMMHIIGLELDFHESSEARGFLFSNPTDSVPGSG
ncbi:MAG: hypothetical protein DHS20C17_04960 [Cyclobacteriaceae bacterium]|nr:MAG: hypothetical protein DHS20C17_04960 [Cyclobacteriaceae bacterium]